MAVYFGYGDWHEIDVELLYKVSLVPVCSKAILKDEHPLDSPQDLQHYPLIHVSKRLYEWPEWLHISKIEYKGFNRGLQLSSSQLATTAARENLGIALADRTMTAREIESGKLIMPFDILLDSQRAFYLVHNKNPMMTYGMRVFKEWVIDEVHNEIPE
jgi:LysR family glycine cleavage system transcriptional activator